VKVFTSSRSTETNTRGTAIAAGVGSVDQGSVRPRWILHLLAQPEDPQASGRRRRGGPARHRRSGGQHPRVEYTIAGG